MNKAELKRQVDQQLMIQTELMQQYQGVLVLGRLQGAVEALRAVREWLDQQKPADGRESDDDDE